MGVEGLRVVDASIFPTLMAAGCNLPVMMAAEKISAALGVDA
jgi:5-(hydroxymethyl)furfural/furfural oxidase